MQTFKSYLKESPYSKRTTALLPASRVLFDKNKVTPKEINSYSSWSTGKHTIQVTHHNGDPKKVRHLFSSGHLEHHEGQVIHGHHDQTGAKIGEHHVVNTIHVTDGKIVKSHKSVDADQKGALLVYK